MREPIILGLAPAAVTAVITAIVNVLREFGIAAITDAQMGALNGLAVALMTVLGAVGLWWARRRTTPTADPILHDGQHVTLPNGDAAHVERG